MTQTYYTLLTKAGAAEFVNAQASGGLVQITHIVVGDGGGSQTYPSEDNSTLVREVHKSPITSIGVDETNKNWLVIETVIPATVGGFTIREIGAISSTGKLLAIGNFPASYKPVLTEGVARDMTIRMIVAVSSASVVNLIIDPSVTVATAGTINKAIAEHIKSADPHPNCGFAVKVTSINAGDGLSGGGDLSGDRTISLAQPGTLTTTTKNVASTDGHTHAVTFPVTSVIGKTGAVTITPAEIGAAPAVHYHSSGINADTLGGAGPGYFAVASHTHAYVPTNSYGLIGQFAIVATTGVVGNTYSGGSNGIPAGTWRCCGSQNVSPASALFQRIA